MNGLQIIEFKEKSFFGKITGRDPKENAFIEINNIIATRPIRQVDPMEIEAILEKYKLSPGKAKSRLLNIYAQVLRYYIRDFLLSAEEISAIQHLFILFSLTPDEIGRLNAEVIYPVFQVNVRKFISDGRLDDKEKGWLKTLSAQLHIPEILAEQLFTREAQAFYQEAANKALADRMLSPAEEEELGKIAKSLELTVGIDQHAKAALERFRYLWRLSQGNLPKVEVPIYLQKGEACAVFAPASHYEHKTITKAIRYSGDSFSYEGWNGRRYRSGTVRTERVTEDVVQLKDTGDLYFTNKRLLFNGSAGSKQIMLQKIVGATFYPDGMIVEKDAGKDQIFKIDGDLEAIQVIFDTLISISRQ